MLTKSSLLSLLLLSATSLIRAEEDAPSDVWSLTEATFEEKVNPQDLILVEFFAPWCGHCKALAPNYEEAATELKSQDIPLAKVDCVAEADLCSKFEVTGYPTLKIFRKGSHTPYTGGRKAEDIISFMKKQALPAVSLLTSETFASFSTSDRTVVIGFFTQDSTPSKTFTNFANLHRDDYLFGVVTDPEVAKSEGVELDSNIVLYKTFDEGKNVFEHKIMLDTGKLESWLKEKSFPLVDEIGPENFAKYADSGLPIAYLFVDPEDSKRETLVESIKPVAQKFKGKINFCWINGVKFADHGKSLNLVPGELPGFVIQYIQEGTKFPLTVALEVSNIEEFTGQVLDGKIAPSIKSEPIPASQDEPVYVLVADEFDKVLFEEGKDKDILVEFYAPWCGHCKKLAPTYEKLAETYSSIKDKLLVVKMDATNNDVPPSAGFKVQGFPTIKFKPAGSTSFIDYDGARELDDFVTYLEKHAKNDLSLKKNDSKVVVEETVVVEEGKVIVDQSNHDEL